MGGGIQTENHTESALTIGTRYCSYNEATQEEDTQMPTDTVVRARIDSETKARATEALSAMGLSVSDAIRLLVDARGG